MFKELITESLPKFQTIRPMTKTKLWFRPILVKEEKKILAAQELGKKDEIVKCVSELLDSCYEHLNAEKLPTFEFDYLFIQLRMKSISESVNAKFTCPETEEKIDLTIDLGQIQVVGVNEYKDKVKITDQLVITFRPPTYNDLLEISDDLGIEELSKLAAKCIVKVDTPTDSYEVDKSHFSDLNEMVKNMTKAQYDKIIKYFDQIPTYNFKYTYKTSDGVERAILISGIEDFFTLASVI